VRCDCTSIARWLVCYKQPRFDKLVLLSRVEPSDATALHPDLPRSCIPSPWSWTRKAYSASWRTLGPDRAVPLPAKPIPANCTDWLALSCARFSIA
jgi:hypothetical protein